MYIALENYKHNKNQSLPTGAFKNGYIDDQDQFGGWKFGFKTFDENGCGVISLYNFLVSQNRTPDLASLILLCELMNADLGLGYLGLNPISNELMSCVSNLVAASLLIIGPLLHIYSPTIAEQITNLLISFELEQATEWWQELLINASIPIQYAAILVAVNAAIPIVILAVNFVTEFYPEHLCGIPDILRVLGYQSLDITYLSYDSSNSGRIAFGYFIITFFNKVPNFLDYTTLSAHTIFIKREIQNELLMTTYNNSSNNKTNFYSFYTDEYSTRSSQFISGVTIKG
ncbi:MAG: hypothetical protein LBV58_02760 [Acholeplasmatales bacterium]|jgi:hypothetical protein|nr:hypothetical protein [Acholeplasmatales bacterium]